MADREFILPTVAKVKEFALPTETEVAVLELLVGQNMHGAEMVKASGRLNRSAIYVILNRMENKGLISSRIKDDSGPTAGRRIYSVTGHGQRTYGAWQQAQVAFGSASNLGEA